MNNAVINPVQYQKKLPLCDSKNRHRDHNTRRLGVFEADALWKPVNKTYKPGILGFDEEIRDFVAFISPTHEEHWVREIVVAKVKNVVCRLWPECRVDVFGSFNTGLYLPTSDIDMVIFGRWETLPLRTLENALKISGIASEIKVLSSATVPIVKLTDVDTGLHVDISFNMINSVRAADLIRSFTCTYPCLQYLVFILKQFLLQRDLNEVWTGGISSYALILMIVSFLQNSIRKDAKPECINLGTLLIEFFELYGRNFNYLETAIRVRNGESYTRKDLIQNNNDPGSKSSILTIEDPLCPENDVGRRSYGAILVKQAFEFAYVVLSHAVLPQYNTSKSRGDSILARIIRISDNTIQCRQRVRFHAQQLYLLIPHVMYSFQPAAKASPGQTTTNSNSNASIPSSQANSSSSNLQCDQSTVPITNKDPIIVSTRGFASQPPPLLRAPFSNEMLRLSTPIPYGYPQPFLYEPNMSPTVINFNSSIPTGPNFKPPVLVLFPHQFSAVSRHGSPVLNSQTVSNVDESTTTSKISESNSDNSNLSDSTASPLIQEKDYLNSSEYQKNNCDIKKQPLTKKHEVSHSVASIGNLSCSSSPNQNAIQSESTSYQNSNMQENSSPENNYTRASSDNDSIAISLVKHLKDETKCSNTFKPKIHSKSKYTRRRRKENGCTSSTEESENMDEKIAFANTINVSTNGYSLKRRCSRVAEAAAVKARSQANKTADSIVPSETVGDNPLTTTTNNVWFLSNQALRTSSTPAVKSAASNNKSNACTVTSNTKPCTPQTHKRVPAWRPR